MQVEVHLKEINVILNAFTNRYHDCYEKVNHNILKTKKLIYVALNLAYLCSDYQIKHKEQNKINLIYIFIGRNQIP